MPNHNNQPATWVAVLKSSAIRDAQICSNTDCDPCDDAAWFDADELEGFMGIYQGTYDDVMKQAAEFACTDKNNIILLQFDPGANHPETKLVSFENGYAQGPNDIDGNAAIASITIDGYPEDGDGQIVCVIYLTRDGGFIVDWHHNGYKTTPAVLELIEDSKETLRQQYL